MKGAGMLVVSLRGVNFGFSLLLSTMRKDLIRSWNFLLFLFHFL